MRRWIGLLAALLTVGLCGCTAAQQAAYEVVDDAAPTGVLADAAYTIRITPPDGSIPVQTGTAGCEAYGQIDGEYEIVAQTVMADSLDTAVYALSGFRQPQLQVIALERDGMQAYQFAWCTAAEQGQMICRATVCQDGDYYYALCVSVLEGMAAEYNDCVNEVFASFELDTAVV